MAPKVTNITHTPNTRQGVNTQVREIPLLPADSWTGLMLRKEGNDWSGNPVQLGFFFFFSNTKYWCVLKKQHAFICSLYGSTWRRQQQNGWFRFTAPKYRTFAGKDERVQMTPVGSIVRSPGSFSRVGTGRSSEDGASRHVCTHHPPVLLCWCCRWALWPPQSARDCFIYSARFKAQGGVSRGSLCPTLISL